MFFLNGHVRSLDIHKLPHYTNDYVLTTFIFNTDLLLTTRV